MSTFKAPRLTSLVLISALLFLASHIAQDAAPGSLTAVSLYKLHMASLAGWAGYWLDRLTFPYARPHELLDQEQDAQIHGTPVDAEGALLVGLDMSAAQAMQRRAIIIAACIVGICLGA
jgi:hypothetical protein